MQKKAIVTGGAGFIGSHMVECLLNEGYSVIAIDDMSNGQQENIDLFKDNPNYTFLKIDLSKEFDDTIFKNATYIFHMAALADIVPSVENPINYHNANVKKWFSVHLHPAMAFLINIPLLKMQKCVHNILMLSQS